MFNEQDGGMLDYYDLNNSQRKEKIKRKPQRDEERTKTKKYLN